MKIKLDAKEIANGITVSVDIKRHKQWLFRLWIAEQLIRLATLIAWVDVGFNEEKSAAKLLSEILKSYDLWHKGKPEIAEEISATMDISLRTAKNIVGYFDDNEYDDSDNNVFGDEYFL